MHDSGAREFSQTGNMIEQCIQQGPAWVSRARMHHQSRRFVDDQDIRVFVNDRKGYILSHPTGIRRWRYLNPDQITRDYRIAW